LRILVININRSGSTNLCKGLSKYFNLEYYPSPFREYILNQPKDLEFYKKNPNILHVRVLNHTYESLSELIDIYDNVILLSRNNLKEAIESWAYVSYYRDRQDVSFKTHVTKYVWEKTENYQEIESHLKRDNEIIKKLASEFNLPITYYEDLYYNNPSETIKSLNLGIDYDNFKTYLDTTKRQRILSKNKNII